MKSHLLKICTYIYELIKNHINNPNTGLKQIINLFL